jgi:hypothetical protein
MTMFSTTVEANAAVPAATELPADVAMVMSALEAGRHGRAGDRRAGHRRPLRVAAAVRLYADADRPPVVVYTRDVGGRNVGFLTRERLPLGYGGTIELPGPAGDPVRVACVLLRCSPCAPGWYDASAAFNRLQPQFE